MPQNTQRAAWLQRGKWLLSALILVAVVVVVIRQGAKIDWPEVLDSLRRYDPWVIAAAFGLSVIGYAAVCSYDLLAKRYVPHGISPPVTLSIAYVCYAVNLNVGALLGGMGFRYRLYSRYGLKTGEITQIIGLGVLTNWSGFILLGGLLLFLSPPELRSSWHVGTAALKGLGLLLIAVVAAYVMFCAAFKGRSREIRGVTFECPTPGFALLQIGVSSINWLAVSAAVAQLLPDTLHFSAVMIAFMASSLGGLVVRLPAGIGVLEGTFIGILGGSIGHGRLLAALLAFRAVYYIAPLVVAALMHVSLELMAKRSRSQPA